MSMGWDEPQHRFLKLGWDTRPTLNLLPPRQAKQNNNAAD